MKISFITTVLNEEKTIERLLVSLSQQTRKPDEIIICDGGSTDKTEKIIFNQFPNFQFFKIKGNRAKGRNEAIRQAKNEIIVMSDAGCELDKKWVEEITKPFEDDVDVVAGYYQVSKDANIFERCVACYALVMPDKVDPENFLPSSRSMAIRKSVWEKFGGFPEDFSDNEDYVLACRVKNGEAKIVFKKEAIVYWQPVSNLKDFFTMILRFARGDAKAGLRKGKVATVFGRYIVFLFLFYWGPPAGGLGIFGYLGWAILKNFNYVKDPLAVFYSIEKFVYLPILQVVADLAIMVGTIEGNYDKLRRSN